MINSLSVDVFTVKFDCVSVICGNSHEGRFLDGAFQMNYVMNQKLQGMTEIAPFVNTAVLKTVQ